MLNFFVVLCYLSVTVNWLLPNAVADESTDCSIACTDYHRVCPGVLNKTFIHDFKEEIKDENYDIPELLDTLPETADCSHFFLRSRCPMSCGTCIPCWAVMLKNLSDNGTEMSSQRNSELQPKSDLIEIIGAVATDPWFKDQSVIENTFNGIEEKTRHEENCYVSSYGDPPSVYYTIPLATVKEIALLSIGYRSTYSESQFAASVCEGTSCVRCGRFPDIPPSKWGTLKCPEGAKGDTVKIVYEKKKDNPLLKFCEIQIFGHEFIKG